LIGPHPPDQAVAAGSGEFLDDPATPAAALRATLRDQAWINRYLGGGQATWAHAGPYLRRCSSDPLRVLEIGCGGGDILRRLVAAARRPGRPLVAVGLDRNPRVLACAAEWSRDYPEIRLLCADALDLPLRPGSFDLVLLPTFLHHLPPDRAPALLREAARLSRGLVVVADLAPSPLARLGWPLLAALLRLHPVSRHDGLLSLRHAPAPADLAACARAAGLRDWSLHRHPWCRQALVCPGAG
jgi:SAM-dependent methyltransferase